MGPVMVTGLPDKESDTFKKRRRVAPFLFWGESLAEGGGMGYDRAIKSIFCQRRTLRWS